MTTMHYGDGRRTNIDAAITDDELRERIAELRGHDQLTREQSDELRDYEHHLAQRATRREKLLGRATDPEWVARNGERAGRERTPAREPDEPQTPLGRSRDLARRTIDAAVRSGSLPDYAAARAEALVSQGPAYAQSAAARIVAATGDPAYERAFATKVTRGDDARDIWTDDERRAWQRVLQLQSEQRAMGISADNAGGYMVPLTLDPSILLTSDGSTNPLRAAARVVQTATDSWNGVSSAGASAEWKPEGNEVADASPTLGQPNIPVHLGDAFVPYSFELEQDAPRFVAELRTVLLDAADQLQAAAYMTGSGVGQPTGLVTALPAGSKVATATADTVVAADVVGLQNALPPRFQPRARWMGNLATINEIGSFETANGSLRFPEVGSGSLLRKPLDEASHLAAAGDTAAAGNDNVLIYGDFQQFVIVDRIGSTLELVPHLFGANGRPTGQRGALLWFRTGSDVVVPEAFRLLTA